MRVTDIRYIWPRSVEVEFRAGGGVQVEPRDRKVPVGVVYQLAHHLRVGGTEKVSHTNGFVQKKDAKAGVSGAGSPVLALVFEFGALCSCGLRC